MTEVDSEPYADLDDTENSESNHIMMDAVISTTAYLAALAQVELVIQFKERQANIPNVSEDIYKCLQLIDGWEQLRCVLCFRTMFESNKWLKVSIMIHGENIYMLNALDTPTVL